MTRWLGAGLRRVEDYAADHGRAVAVMLVLASTWGRLPGAVIVDVPLPLALAAFIAVIVAAAVVIAAEFYKVNVFAEDWDRVVDDADRGARAADGVALLAEGLEELADVVSDLAATADTIELPAVQPAPAPEPRPRPTPGPRTQPAATVLADQADEWRQRFTFSDQGRRP